MAVLKHAVKFRRVDDPEAEPEVRIIFNIALDRDGKAGGGASEADGIYQR